MTTQPHSIELFTPQDAEGVVALYREIYGDKFPLADVYRPEWHVQQAQSHDSYRGVARLPDGKIVGSVALYRSVSTNPDLYEAGGLMVAKDYRQQNLAIELFNFLTKYLSVTFDIGQIWGEAVCNHIVSQHLGIKAGYVPCAIEIEMMPEETFQKLNDRGMYIQNRVSNVVQFLAVQHKPQDIYLPSAYEEILKKIYSVIPGAQQRRFCNISDFLSSAGSTEFHLNEYPDAGFSRIAVSHIGDDFSTWLTPTLARLSESSWVVSQIILPLNTPRIESATQNLLQHGYFLGGVMPRWFGGDGFMLQRLAHQPNWEKIKVYSAATKALLQFIRDDYQRLLCHK